MMFTGRRPKLFRCLLFCYVYSWLFACLLCHCFIVVSFVIVVWFVYYIIVKLLMLLFALGRRPKLPMSSRDASRHQAQPHQRLKGQKRDQTSCYSRPLLLGTPPGSLQIYAFRVGTPRNQVPRPLAGLGLTGKRLHARNQHLRNHRGVSVACSNGLSVALSDRI